VLIVNAGAFPGSSYTFSVQGVEQTVSTPYLTLPATAIGTYGVRAKVGASEWSEEQKVSVVASCPCAGGLGTTVAGTCWANVNVDDYQTFAARPDMYTAFYQWNRATAYSATDPLPPAWDATADNSATWTNNPCPAGWRMPTPTEQTALVNSGYTWAAAGAKGNAVEGGFLGSNHASCTMSSLAGCIFIPATGYRNNTNGALRNESAVRLWSSTQKDAANGYSVVFDSTGATFLNNSNAKSFGFKVRCVLE
jgi:uncharacterized protein (TIGR02145 family)